MFLALNQKANELINLENVYYVSFEGEIVKVFYRGGVSKLVCRRIERPKAVRCVRKFVTEQKQFADVGEGYWLNLDFVSEIKIPGRFSEVYFDGVSRPMAVTFRIMVKDFGQELLGVSNGKGSTNG